MEYALVAALVALVGWSTIGAVGGRLSLLLYNTSAHLTGTPPKEEPPESS